MAKGPVPPEPRAVFEKVANYGTDDDGGGRGGDTRRRK